MTTHATLKSDLATFAARDDLDTTIPTLVTMLEARIARRVRVRDMEQESDITITSQSADLPDGYLAGIRLYIDDATNFKLDYLPPDKFWDQASSHVAGSSYYYTIEGGKLKFGPYISGSTIYGKMLYYRRYDALDGDADTNWLLTNHYDIYVKGGNAELKSLIEDDEQFMKWESRFEKAVEEVNSDSRRSRRGQSTKKVSRAP